MLRGSRGDDMTLSMAYHNYAHPQHAALDRKQCLIFFFPHLLIIF